jgi:hypothetical protein
MRDFWFFFAVQFLAYGLFCWNARAIAFAWIGNIAMSDAAIGAINFLVIKKVAEAKSRSAMAGYVIGGVAGSIVSVLLTKHLLG